MDWTTPQREAIEHAGGDLLVAAGAGAGKTGVLTERVVRRVLAGECSINQLLVVTFTEAAAGEMRRRIAGKLQAALAEARQRADARALRRIRSQIVLLDAGQICTLHSFCGHLLRENFHHLGLDPAFEILGEDEAALIRQEILDELLEGCYNAAGPQRQRFEQLLHWGGGKAGDDWLRRTILRLDAKVNSLHDPQQWWRQVDVAMAATPGGTLAESAWAQPLRRLMQLELDAIVSQLELAHAGAGSPLRVYAERAEQLLNYVREIKDCLGAADFWPRLEGLLAGRPNDRMPPVREGTPGKAAVKKLLDSARKALADLAEMTQRRESDLLADVQAAAPAAQMLAELCRGYAQGYAAAKRDRGQLDFADLERLALRLLEDFEAVRSATAEQYVEVLVDEYQDISPVQDAILRAAAGRDPRAPSPLRAGDGRGGGALPAGRLFMVGDLKQSIYRFRLAEPDIFAQAMDVFCAKGSAGRLIHLPENFRSRGVIIDAANTVFEQLMRPVAGLTGSPCGSIYDEAARLRFAAQPYTAADSPPDEPVELHLLASDLLAGADEPDEDEGDGQGESDAGGPEARPPDSEDEAAQAERIRVQAIFVGRRIRQLLGLDGGQPVTVWDDASRSWRPARQRDVVILLRTASRIAQQFAEELSGVGLGVHAAQPGGYFEAVEVSDVRSLLAVLDNPRQDIPLAAVLRSPLMALARGDGDAPAGGLTAEELVRIRLAHPDGQLYDAVRAAAQSPESGDVPPALAHRLAAFCDQIDHWRTMARRRPLGELLADIFRATGYLDYVCGLRGGPQRRANLLHLVRRARQFDTFARQGLARFARYLDELEQAGEELGVPSALSEADDVVRIMTIHAAKGLEFPIVVLADLEHGFNVSDSREEVLFHRELLLGLRRLDESRRIRFACLPHRLIQKQIGLESAAEEMRLLYVAMTRARERLILVGSERGLLKRLRLDWREPPDESSLLRARRPLDWLARAILPTAGRAILDAVEPLKALPAEPLTARSETFAVQVYPSAWVARMVDAGPWGASDAHAVAGETLAVSRTPELSPREQEILDAAAAQITFRYPQEAMATQPAKQSVSELKALFETRVEPDEQPAPGMGEGRWSKVDETEGAAPKPEGLFDIRHSPLDISPPPWRQPPSNSAIARGLATHAVLQRLDLSAELNSPRQVAEQIAAMQRAGLLAPHQPEWVDAAAVAAFFASDVGVLLRAGRDRVRREWSFSLAVPAAELLAAPTGGALRLESAGDFVLVQGVIDVLFEQADGSLMVLDFKTDAVRGQRQIAERAQAYRSQLSWYARAASTILGKPVSRRTIYFLAPGALIDLTDR